MDPQIEYEQFTTSPPVPGYEEFWIAHVTVGGLAPSTPDTPRFAKVGAEYTGVPHGSGYGPSAKDPVSDKGEVTFNVWVTKLGGTLTAEVDGVVQSLQKLSFSKVLAG